MSWTTSEQARKYGTRGGRNRAAIERWCIEGEHLSVTEIADRLGVSRVTVQVRLREARRAEGPVTWAALRRGAAKP